MPQTASSVDPSGFDTVLLRTGAWGTAAVLAAGVLVYAGQTDTGAAQVQLALSRALGTHAIQPITQTARAAPTTPAPALAALEAKLDRLSAERTRLEARLAMLEHGLEDVTGSIRRQADKPQSKPATPPPFIEPPVIPSISTLPPARPQAESMPAQNTPAASLPEEPPLPRARPRPGMHVEYGVELGTAPDMDALRARWLSVKANHGPILVGLSPVAVKDKRPGSTQLRLMAGPLKSMAAARELCAKFVAANGYCWPTRVDATEVVQR